MVLRIHVADSRVEKSVHSSIPRLKHQVCASIFLVEIYPVKRGDPGIKPDKANHPKIQ
jgi:hypothetical protein